MKLDVRNDMDENLFHACMTSLHSLVHMPSFSSAQWLFVYKFIIGQVYEIPVLFAKYDHVFCDQRKEFMLLLSALTLLPGLRRALLLVDVQTDSPWCWVGGLLSIHLCVEHPRQILAAYRTQNNQFEYMHFMWEGTICGYFQFCPPFGQGGPIGFFCSV